MPGPLPWPPRIVQVVINYTGPDGQAPINVMHVQTASAVTTADLTSLANSIQALAVGSSSSFLMLTYLTSAFSRTNVVCTDVSGVAGEASSTGASFTGLNGSPPLPANCACCVSWFIARRYRGGHPRNYLPGVTEQALDTAGGRLLSPSFIANQITAMNTFLTGVNAITLTGGGACKLGSIQRGTTKYPIASPLFWPFTGVTVHPKVATQRRRLGRPPGI